MKRLATLGWLGLPVELTLAKLFILLTLLVWVFQLLYTKDSSFLSSPFKRILNTAIILYLFAACLSLLNATEPFAGIAPVARRLIVILIYYLIINIVRDNKSLRISIIALIIGNIPNILGGIYELISHQPIIDNRLLISQDEDAGVENSIAAFGGYIRVQSFLLDPDIFAYFTILIMGLVLASLFSTFFFRSKLIYTLLVLLVTMHIINVFAASSRAGWLGLFGCLVTFFLFMRIKYKALLLAGITVITIILFTGLALLSETPILSRLMGESGHHSISQREEDAKLGMTTFKSAPILGVGMGNVEIVRHRFFKTVPGYLEKPWIKYFTNGYIQILAECGLIGLCCYLLIVISFIMMMVKVIRHSTNRGQMTLALGILASFSGHLIMLIAYNLHDSEIVWILTGFGMALYTINEKETSSTINQKTPPSWVGTILYPQKEK
ncbi:O-antigen polymerase [Candidatus Scalindua japonica]|uniref:O-antigen polymerase n=1 Tax=Candidatus Scalindua japonica TaxID=1284222 RepID=A0A286TX22_9BACT|nr:O-antigen ligase family protein [Candidatus Scalindua japonica]GAX60420.1 O-antigen polymerase [Candidatus Scalindua japonica]